MVDIRRRVVHHRDDPDPDPAVVAAQNTCLEVCPPVLATLQGESGMDAVRTAPPDDRVIDRLVEPGPLGGVEPFHRRLGPGIERHWVQPQDQQARFIDPEPGGARHPCLPGEEHAPDNERWKIVRGRRTMRHKG
ncbi:hypothetical protein ACFYXM_34770 [Streptomyces sp. NPDC002476]|uniref:hypothetical protein n=1 Tax=Streptomyces sp. NPDC002476 TaxID=3364648 RepID=UPI0036AFA850